MPKLAAAPDRVNDFVVKFANVNGTGSASANSLIMKTIFRMGVPVTGKNYFPSNIQGLPTWYEIRVTRQGYAARAGRVDIMVAMNAEAKVSRVAESRVAAEFLDELSCAGEYAAAHPCARHRRAFDEPTMAGRVNYLARNVKRRRHFEPTIAALSRSARRATFARMTIARVGRYRAASRPSSLEAACFRSPILPAARRLACASPRPSRRCLSSPKLQHAIRRAGCRLACCA